jgi:lipopolysaccharide biosynthesis glycosyltransferase
VINYYKAGIRMKKQAIVTGGTKSDVAAMAVLAMNIKETNSHLFDTLVIFHDGIREKDQKLINSIYKTNFIKYMYPNKSKNDVVVTYFSQMLFCKYECFKLLDEFDTVVWTDYDVVIQGKLDEVCKFSNDYAMNILVNSGTAREMFYKDIQNEDILQYNLTENAISTGLFSISKKVTNYLEIYNWCYDKTSEWDKDLYLPEQCVLQLALQKFKVKYAPISGLIYCCHPRNAKGGEIILHAACQPKFWNGIYNDDWDRRYKEWLGMGGSPYRENLKKISNKWKLLKSRILGVRARK